MATTIILIQLLIVLALIFIGARVGGIGLGIYGMVGVFILVFLFGLKPGNIPLDVMLIIVSVITATAALQAAGGLDYLVGLAARFLRKHPDHITLPLGYSVLWPVQPTHRIRCCLSFPRLPLRVRSVPSAL